MSNDVRDLLVAEGGTLHGWEMFRQIWPRIWLPRNSRDLLHAANLRHGTDGFTSPPKEGVLRIFSPLKIRWLRPGLNPWTWVPKASTLTPRPPKLLNEPLSTTKNIGNFSIAEQLLLASQRNPCFNLTLLILMCFWTYKIQELFSLTHQFIVKIYAYLQGYMFQFYRGLMMALWGWNM